ncbi:MAG TPA: hypothetical protein VGK73_14620 [Polyangiaceae bacterium]
MGGHAHARVAGIENDPEVTRLALEHRAAQHVAIGREDLDGGARFERFVPDAAHVRERAREQIEEG